MVADGNWTYGDHFVINREILNHYVVYLKLTQCCRSIILPFFFKCRQCEEMHQSINRVEKLLVSGDKSKIQTFLKIL